MAANPPHATVCGKLLDFLVPLLLGAYCVRPETNTVLPRSVPEPDFAIARGTRDDYENRHPGPADLVLLIEVSDTSVDCDRGIKKNIYARSGIVEYWIVNICGRQIEVYSQPAGKGKFADYQQRVDYGEGDTIPVRIEGREIAKLLVTSVLPRV